MNKNSSSMVHRPSSLFKEASVSEKNYQLVMQEGPKPGQVFDLVGSTMTIGRDALADIIIVDPEVSRQHLQFTEIDTGYKVQDLGSTNGSFVNGRRLSEGWVDLEPGQEIRLGSTIVLLYRVADEAFVPPLLIDEAEEEVSSFMRPTNFEEREIPTAADFTEFTEQAEQDQADVLSLSDAEDIEAIFGETADFDSAFERELEPETGFMDSPSTEPPVMEPSSPLEPSAPAERAVVQPIEDKRNGPLVPPGKGQPRRGRNRVLLITTLLLLLCCCALMLFMWFVGGDLLI
jgi:pSer/pThr/pTyr-binding forkhead associated (FHA) protein